MELLQKYSTLVEILGLLSLMTFIGSLIAIPWIIARLPQDYFIYHRKSVEKRHKLHPVLAKITFLLRNIIGFIFFLAGIAMLVLPGQGIITILIGISFMDFPKKNELIDQIVRHPRVTKVLNWIRMKEKKPPFEFE